MELVIKILDKDYKKLQDGHISFNVLEVLRNGIPLPKGHGDLKDADKVLKDIEDLQKSSWYNDERFMKMQYLIHEGVETVRDLCIKEAPIIIEADKDR